jgi:hypothetical protein
MVRRSSCLPRELASVVIPTRNRLAYLREAVQSVLIQSHPEIELIVVDDASTDGTSDWLLSQADGRLKTILVKERRERSAGRNLGLAQTRGEWVLFLDEDDKLELGALRVLLEAAHQEPGLVGVSGRMRCSMIRVPCGTKTGQPGAGSESFTQMQSWDRCSGRTVPCSPAGRSCESGAGRRAAAFSRTTTSVCGWVPLDGRPLSRRSLPCVAGTPLRRIFPPRSRSDHGLSPRLLLNYPQWAKSPRATAEGRGCPRARPALPLGDRTMGLGDEPPLARSQCDVEPIWPPLDPRAYGPLSCSPARTPLGQIDSEVRS